jgi:hypothetical protein
MAVLSSILGRREVAPAVGAQMISATELPPELRPYYKDILTKAQALYNDRTAQGYQPYTGPTLAEFTPEQQQVQAGIAGLVGSGAPVYQEAMGMTREAATPYTAAQVEEYMSPYQQAVTDIEKREAQKQFESQVVPELAAKAAMAQPFGGSRQAILEGMAADTQQRLLGDIQAKGSQQAYQDAIARLDADRIAKGQAATQLANLGSSQFKQATTELSGLQAIGQEKQRQSQTALDEAFQQYLEEQQFPYDTMAKYQSVVTGAPIRPMQYVPPQQAQYEPSLGQQLIGGLGGLGNIYGAFTGRTLSGQPLVQGSAKSGGGIGTLIKRANGGGDLSVDESLLKPFEDAPELVNTAPMVNKYLSSLGDVEEAFARSRKSQLENEKLAKQQVDYQKSLLEADKANQQFNREQAAFAAMARLGTDQDVTDAPGGGAGQLLTMLAKAGPEIGASEKEQRAKLRESQKNLIDLEMQYNKALADGDMNLAMQLSEVMKGGAGVEIDIGTLNATLAKNNIDNTLQLLKLAKVSEPVQKSMKAHAAGLLGYNATFDKTGNLQVNSKGKPLSEKQEQTLTQIDRVLQNIYADVINKTGNQADALAAVKNYTLAEDIQLPKIDIKTPNIDNTINQSILKSLQPAKITID